MKHNCNFPIILLKYFHDTMVQVKRKMKRIHKEREKLEKDVEFALRKSMLSILASMLLMFMMFHASPIIANAEKDSLDEIQKERDEVKKDVSSTEEEIEEIVDEVEGLNNE